MEQRSVTYSDQNFKTIVEGEPVLRKNPKILLYTNFFGKMNWYEESKDVYTKKCPAGCTITNDKSQIDKADAVVFHLSDIAWQATVFDFRLQFPFPKYRHPDQVWVFYNLEPLTMIWGDMRHWQGMFNWTWSFTRSSDVYAPYGQYQNLTEEEVKENEKNTELLKYDYFSDRTDEGGIAMISHCTDEVRRYRLIEKLKQYIPVRVVGRCGEGCPDGYMSCNKLLHKYKFYLAFENSDCNDYVSEKYWRALTRKQIPIVAWEINIDGIVIPGSYINVRDFPDLDTAGSYIQEVSRNKTLYNSYFEWQFKYKITDQSGYCSLCHKLKDTTVPRMVYRDLYGWIMNYTCQPVSVSLVFFLFKLIFKYIFLDQLRRFLNIK